MRMIVFAIAVALGFCWSCGAASRSDRTGGQDNGRSPRQCTGIRGYLADQASGGRAMYAKPDPRSRVLGRIAEPLKQDERAWEVGFEIRASQNGWLRVQGAADDPALTGGISRKMYGGSGWIRGTGVFVNLQASQAFSAPRHSSEMIIRGTRWIDDFSHSEMIAVVACDRSWVLGRWQVREPRKVRYSARAIVSKQPLRIQGWATGVCNSQETSCDQPHGDRPTSD